MAQNFYCILTSIGKAKMANAYALGNKVNLTTFAVGSGQSDTYYEPTESQTALKNQVWSGNINSINVDSTNTNWIVISAIIPTTDGGFTIREAGIFDDTGDMIAVGKYPETYKPQLSEGSSKDLTINMILEISNTSTVTLKIDPTVVLATKSDIQNVNNRIATDELTVSTLTADVLESTGYGVINGLTVTAQATPNMTVNVAGGIVHMPNGIRLAPSSNSSLNVSAADSTNPRIDIIYVKSDGTIGYTAGIPSSTPVAPVIPTGAFLLAQINVNANVTNITNANLIDMRKIKNTTDSVENDILSHKADYVRQPGYGIDTGTANHLIITLDPAPTSYVDGMGVVAKVKYAGTAAEDINVNGLGVKAIYDNFGNAVTNFRANTTYSMKYESVSGTFIVQGKGGGGTLQPNQALAGFTFTNNNGLQTGLGDTNLVASNILSGKSIFGVAGSAINGAGMKNVAVVANSNSISNGTVLTFGSSFTPSSIILEVSYSFHCTVGGNSENVSSTTYISYGALQSSGSQTLSFSNNGAGNSVTVGISSVTFGTTTSVTMSVSSSFTGSSPTFSVTAISAFLIG